MRTRLIQLAAAAVAASVAVVLVPAVANAADVYSSGTEFCPTTHTAWVEGTSRGGTWHKPPGGMSQYKGFTSFWKEYFTFSPSGNGGGIWRIDALDPYAGLTLVSAACSPKNP